MNGFQFEKRDQEGSTMREVYALRYEATKDYLKGKGLEIGAGHEPQRLPDGAECRYFDVLNIEGLVQRFGVEIKYQVHHITAASAMYPGGADFLIAHNVIEHLHDPIKTLQEWHALVRDGGTIVFSVPDCRHLEYDNGRIHTPFAHVLADYLFERTDRSFESKEHVYSFIFGWQKAFEPRFPTSEGLARYAIGEGNRDGHDFHWHAMDRLNWDKVVDAACWFGKTSYAMHAKYYPFHPTTPSFGEVIYCYEVRRGLSIRAPELIADDLAAMAEELRSARQKLGKINWIQPDESRRFQLSGSLRTSIHLPHRVARGVSRRLHRWLSGRSVER